MKFNFGEAVDSLAADIKNTSNKYAPEALVIAGVVGLIGAGIVACRATLKAPKVAEKSQLKLETVKAMKEDELVTDKQYKKELAKVYAGVTLDWVRLYAPSLVIAGLSAGMVFSSTDILKKRNASLAAAYATIDSAFKKYRKNVVDKYGEAEDIRMLTGAKEETITVEQTDEDGKVKKVKQKVNVIDPEDIENWRGYARIYGDFPKGSVHHSLGFCKNDPNNDYNLMHLNAVQNYMNDLLRINKIVTLNDLYDELGFDRTVAGQQVGWSLNSGKGDGYVDLRINSDFWYKEIDEATGECRYVRGILIDPNCEGYILDSQDLREI